jgi:flagellar biogenesis protein FliO
VRLIAVCIAVAPALLVAQSPYPPNPQNYATPATFESPITAAPMPTGITPQPQPRPAVSLSPPDARPAVKLPLAAPPSADASKPRGSLGSTLFGMFAALGVVIGLFLGGVALLRRGLPKPARVLPTEAVEVLGRLPFPGRQQGHLIRVGNKIALVSFSTGGADSLLEITDPAEVDRLAGLCRQQDTHSATTSFRSVVEQFLGDRSSRSRRPQRDAEAADA